MTISRPTHGAAHDTHQSVLDRELQERLSALMGQQPLLCNQECCLYAGNNCDEWAVWQWTKSGIPEALPGQHGPRVPVGSLQFIPSLIFWQAITEPTYRNVLSSLDLHPGSAVHGLWWIIYPSDFNSFYISLCFLKWLLYFLVFIQIGGPKRGSCDCFV